MWTVHVLNSHKVSEKSVQFATNVAVTVSQQVLCHACFENGVKKPCAADKGLNLHVVRTLGIRRK
jgi:hypothetical protein